MTPKKLVKILIKNGFIFARQNGSHAVFRNEIKKRRVIVPIHNKDIPKGTLHAILRDADIEF